MDAGVNIVIYSDPKFDAVQMEQIRLGLEDGVDASIYADSIFSSAQMKQIRLKLKKKDAINPADGEQASTNSMNLF